MANNATFIVDDLAQRRFLAAYDQRKIDRLFQNAARLGAKAAEPVVKAAAPIGTSKRMGQFYRREGLGPGNLRSTVKARRIRKRGLNAKTIGFAIGPAGKTVSSRRGFIRVWITGGTKPHETRRTHVHHPGAKANPWVDRVRPQAVATAGRASTAAIERYVRSIPGA